ncbi:hypothetical protein L4D08_07510 [Photobacterium chitinilyticum]|uniref:hypothetical protein n=1 Tax=Photobacterium chitinilyticum TaxID=2485123 RepID=UPI003D0F1C5C
MSRWLIYLVLLYGVASASAQTEQEYCDNLEKHHQNTQRTVHASLKPFANEMQTIQQNYCIEFHTQKTLDNADYTDINNMLIRAIEKQNNVLIRNTDMDQTSFDRYIKQLKSQPYIPPQEKPLYISNRELPDGYYDASKSILLCNKNNPDCTRFMTSFFQLLGHSHKLLTLQDVDAAAVVHTNASKQWDQFLEDSLVQMPWELWFNSNRLYSQRQSSANPQLLSPPSYQYIFLRPGLVYDFVSNAEDGSQNKATLMLEGLGIDVWNRKQWYIPSGISVVGLYTDRDGVDDLGWGVALRFKTKFMLGASFYGSDDTGVFLSVDLLELFRDKKQTFKQYKSEFYQAQRELSRQGQHY